jgi:hypothetical protein
VSGGNTNVASGTSAIVAGGSLNKAVGGNSFAAGFRARANHDGAFVWGSSTSNSDSTASFGLNTFTVRCANGARFYTLQTGTTTGVQLAAGGGSWSSLSDKNRKENFQKVDTKKILDKVSQLEVSEWNYKSQASKIRHMGPMAQDFYRLFGLGESDTTITQIDPDGVMLAAIQELAKELDDSRTAVRRYEMRNSELEERVARLEKMSEGRAMGGGQIKKSNWTEN